MLKKVLTATAAAGVAAGALTVTSAIAAPSAAPAHHGRISILIVAHGSGKSYDVVTGAIADYGTDADAGHNQQKVTLTKGTFKVSAGDFNKNFRSKADKTTCAVTATSHATVPLSDGTGAYTGITGKLTIEGRFAQLSPRKKDGSCDFNGRPISASDVITGSGTVSYG